MLTVRSQITSLKDLLFRYERRLWVMLQIKGLVGRQISFPLFFKENAYLCVSFYTSEWLPVPTCVIHSSEKMSELYHLTNSMGVQPSCLSHPDGNISSGLQTSGL